MSAGAYQGHGAYSVPLAVLPHSLAAEGIEWDSTS